MKLSLAFAFLSIPFMISSCEDVDKAAKVTEVAMPDLLGLSLDEAKGVLDVIGISVDLIYSDIKGVRFVLKDKNWKVVKQDPKAGVSIKRDETICLSLIKLEESTFLDLTNKCLNEIKERRRLYFGEDPVGNTDDSHSPNVTIAPETTLAPTTSIVSYSDFEYDLAFKRMRFSEDEVLGNLFLEDKSSPAYIDEKGFFAYIAYSSGYQPLLRLKIQYAGSDYIFWNKLTTNVDGLIFAVKFSYWDVKRDVGPYKAWEWVDAVPSDETTQMLDLIAKSEKTVIRLEGSQFSSDRVLSASEKTAIANVLTVYDGLKTGRLRLKP